MKKIIILALIFSLTVFATCKEQATKWMQENKGTEATTTDPAGGIDPGGDPDKP